MKNLLRFVASLFALCLVLTACPNSSAPVVTKYKVSITVVGTGTVVKTPSATEYEAGSSVILTATPASGFLFSGWSGDSSGSTNPLTLAVNADMSITATFSAIPISYTLAVSANDATKGDVSVSPLKSSYSLNEEITLTASPSGGNAFDSWEENGSTLSSGNPYKFNITKNASITANFSKIVPKHQVTFAVSPASSGSTTVASGQFSEGSSIDNVSANPASHYLFDRWIVDGGSPITGNPHSFAVGASDMTITAYFVPAPTVTPSVAISPVGGGTVSLNPASGPYYEGDSVTASVTASPGYAFAGWSGDLNGTQSPKAWVLDTSPSVTAAFVATHALSISAVGATAALVASPSGTVFNQGTSVTVTAPEVSGYVFDGWKEGGTWVGSPQQNSYSVLMDQDRTLTANYSANSATILAYMDGDNSLDSFAIDDFNEMEAADLRGTGINVVVLLDRSATGAWTDSRAYKVRYGGSATPDTTITSPRVACSNLGLTAVNTVELNMGSPATLGSFVAWGKSTFPSPHNMLIFWNHGGGWRKAAPQSRSAISDFGGSAAVGTGFTGTKPGASVDTGITKALCEDDTSGSILYTKNLGDTLANASFDVLGFDLCLGGMIEVAYELRNKASYMIASEESTPGDGWEYNLWLTDFAAKGSRTGLQLVNSVVDAYQSRYSGSIGATLAGYDLSKVDGLMTALNEFSTALSASIVDKASQTAIGNLLFKYVEDYFSLPGDLNIDIWDMADKVAAGGYAAAQATALKAALAASVIKEWHDTTAGGSGNPNSHGMSIHFVQLDAAGTPTGHLYAYFANHASLSPTTLYVPSFVDAAGNSWVPTFTSSTVGSGLLYKIFYRAYP